MVTATLQRDEVGLLDAEGRTVPLQGVAISVDVRSVASKVTVKQRYRNDGSKPIEATYCFPLNECAAVCDYAIQVGEEEIRADIEEREKAFERYDDAMAEGHGAYLLDQERPDIFVASVGNLNPMLAVHNNYPCAGDDKWVSIAVLTEAEWQGFCRAMGSPEWARSDDFVDGYRRMQNRKSSTLILPLGRPTRRRRRS